MLVEQLSEEAVLEALREPHDVVRSSRKDGDSFTKYHIVLDGVRVKVVANEDEILTVMRVLPAKVRNQLRKINRKKAPTRKGRRKR